MTCADSYEKISSLFSSASSFGFDVVECAGVTIVVSSRQWKLCLPGVAPLKDKPITVYYYIIGKLDTADVGGGISKLQGEHRLARGRNFYKTGKRVARKKHWDFNWEKVEVKNVGHSGWGMVYGLKHNKISEYSEDEYLKTSAYYLIYKKRGERKEIVK